MSDFDNVKQRADLVEVVSGYVALQKAGRYFKAPCPFHNEKTPSFYVYPERQSWHCFGACATGGDVISFIEKQESMTPVEAMKLLADRYGVTLEKRSAQQDDTPTKRLIEANETAARYFHDLLLQTPEGEPARAYLERRGVDAETILAFQLGASAPGYSGLKAYLLERGFSVAELVAAGLLIEGERGDPYDRFRNRVMFPIRDDRGRVVGFGGRVLDTSVPKYLNSPQTALFDKSATLYALDQAKEAARAGGEVIVVEGYMDAIAAHQYGLKNVVATLGTALTERHVALLRRYVRRVVLSMDADAAGIEAALRGEEVVRNAKSEEGDESRVVVDWRNLVRVQAAAPLDVRVFAVPQGKDPDDAIRADPAAFQALIREAEAPFEFRLRHELKRIDRNDPRERLALADRLLPLIAGISDRTVQAQYLTRLAQATALTEDLLVGRLRGGPPPTPPAPGEQRRRPPAPPDALVMRERATSASPRPAARASLDETLPPDDDGWAGGPMPEEEMAVAPTPLRPIIKLPGLKQELFCLKLLFTYDALRADGMALNDTLLLDPANRQLLLAWKAHGAEAFAGALDAALAAQHSLVLNERTAPFDATQAGSAFADVVRRLQLRRLTDSERLLAAALREAEAQTASEVVAARAFDLLTDEAPPPLDAEDLEGEAATRLVQQSELARDRLAIESGLRQHTPVALGGGEPP